MVSLQFFMTLVNADVLIDNLMFQFLTEQDVFGNLVEQRKSPEHKFSLSPTKLPQSPSRRMSDTPKLRSSQQSEGSALLSATSTTLRIPALLQPMMQKITRLGKISLFRQIPYKIQQYEQLILNSLREQLDSDLVQVQTTERMNLSFENKDYYTHIERWGPEALPPLQVFTEEVLGLPRSFTPLIVTKLPENLHFEDLQALYQKVKHLHPEQRLYEIFGPIDYLLLTQMCLLIIQENHEYSFVQPQQYVDALARVAAARIMFDCDPAGRWVIKWADYIKSGYSLLKVFFETQNSNDIGQLDSAFGYEQFYVLYCLYSKYAPGNNVTSALTEQQLRAFNEFTYSGRFIQRVHQGFGKPLRLKGSFQLEDFVQLVLSDVAFDTQQSCRYMFNVADLYQDDVVDADEFFWFYEQTYQQVCTRGIMVDQDDVLMQLCEMVHFGSENFRFTIGEMQRCRMHMNFFDSMFSCNKFAQFEARDVYIANSELQQGGFPKTHCQSGVWKQFWTAMYENIAGE